MRYLSILILCVHLFSTTQAQSPRNSDLSFAAVLAPFTEKNTNGDPDKKLKANTAQARKKIVALFNLFKDYEVIVDTASMRSAFSDLFKEESSTTVSTAPSEMTAVDFTAYLDKTGKLLTNKLDKISSTELKNDQYWEDLSRVHRALSILQSAYCLAGKERAGSYVVSKDADGYDIICFPLDSLRTNSRYGTIDNYKEGFARIRKDQVYGYLNYCGDEFITCQYQLAESFNHGKALVKKVDWYFLDSKGEESNTLENIVDAKAMSKGISLAKFTNGKFALIDNNYDVSQTPISEYYDAIEPFFKKEIFRVRNGKKFGLINFDGSVKLDINYDKIEPSKQLSKVYLLRLEDAIGIIDSVGNIKFKPSFTAIGDFNRYGLAQAISKDGGVLLINGKTMQATKNYESISNFNKYGLATIRTNEKLNGLIDSTLKIVIEPTYSEIRAFNKYGLAAVSKANHWGFINPLGQEIIPSKYSEVGEYNNYGMVVVRSTLPNCTKGQCLVDAVIDEKGKDIIPVSLEPGAENIRYYVTDTLISYHYVAIVQNTSGNSGFRMIDKRGNKIVNKVAYEAIAPHDQYKMFSFRDMNSKLWGLMDTTGRVWAKPIYKEIKKPKEDYYPTQNEKGKWGYIDKKGKPQIPFEYEDVKSYRAGYAVVSQGKDKWGLINKFNAKVVPCSFKSINVISGSNKFEILDNKDNIFVVNENGDCEKNCEIFEAIRRAANGNEGEIKK